MPWKGSLMSAYSDWVRVREGDVEKTLPAAHAASTGLPVLDKPAVDEFGKPLPVKPVVDKAGKPAAAKEA